MRLASHHAFPAAPGLHELSADGLQHLHVALARVLPEDPISLATGDCEMLVVTIEAQSPAYALVGGRELMLPPRSSVFEQEPSAVYVPPGITLELHGPLLAAIFRSRAPEARGEPYMILPSEVSSVERGRDNFSRRVRDILPADRPASRLLAGETINPPGNWSSSPPHKHDRRAPPEEARLEEIYLFRVRPPQGFALQHSYHAGGPSRTFAVRDLDVAVIPSGYHPVVAAPGYDLYYLWCLAGEGRELRWRADPEHAWVEGA